MGKRARPTSARSSGKRGAGAAKPAANATKWDQEAVVFHLAIPAPVRADVLALLNGKSRQAFPYKAPLPEVSPGVYLVSWIDSHGADNTRSYRYARATLDSKILPRKPRDSYVLTIPDVPTTCYSYAASRPLARQKLAEPARASGSRDAQAEQAPLENKTEAYATHLAALPFGVINGWSPRDLEVSADRLGGGTYGRVYAASSSGTRAAAKVYNGSQAEQSQAVLQELVSYALAGQHPNLVAVMAAGLQDHGGTPRQVLVLERARTSLGELMLERASALAPWETRSIARDLAAGIAALHAKSLAHTDVKPGNVLLFELPRRRAWEKSGKYEVECRYAAKLADLGFAVGLAVDLGLTAPTGTPEYQAPELVGKNGTTPWSAGRWLVAGCSVDAWSYGVVVYEMGAHQLKAVGCLSGKPAQKLRTFLGVPLAETSARMNRGWPLRKLKPRDAEQEGTLSGQRVELLRNLGLPPPLLLRRSLVCLAQVTYIITKCGGIT